MIIAAAALVIVPAVFSAWALSVTAHPRTGFTVDPAWHGNTTGLPAERTAPTVAAMTFDIPGT